MRTTRTATLAAALLAAATLAAGSTAAGAAPTAAPELVSVGADGQPIGADGAIVSEDGTQVLFSTHASSYPWTDIYLRDRAAGTSTREVGTSTVMEVSGNGRYVATDDVEIYLHDLVDGSTEQVLTRRPESLALSDDGRVVAYNVVQNEVWVAYVKNLETGDLTRVSSPGANASRLALSGDGTTLAYRQYGHVYAKNVVTGKISRVDARPDGSLGPRANGEPHSVSDNGRYVLFTTQAKLTAGADSCGEATAGCLYRRNTTASTTAPASVLPSGRVAGVNFDNDLSGDARVAAFAYRYQGVERIYVRVFGTGTTRLASVNAAGQAANKASVKPSLNQDGSLVTFLSSASNLGSTDTRQAWITRGK